MKKPNGQTKLGQKVTLVICGILASLVILEAVLRIGGAIFLFIQERANRISLAKNGQIVILCIGESTTALGHRHSYPRQLEQILNESQKKVKFTVINKGLPAATTTHILKSLKDNLRTYKPSLVVSMMGINDRDDPSVTNWLCVRPNNFVGQLQVSKLFHLLSQHLRRKKHERDASLAEKRFEEIQKKIRQRPSAEEYVKLSNLYKATYQPEKQKEALLKAIELDPKSFKAFGYLGLYYKRKGEQEEAIKMFEKMARFCPEEEKDYMTNVLADLADSYYILGKYEQAASIHKLIIRNIPKHPSSYGSLGDIALERGDFKRAEFLFRKQIAINPQSIPSYISLSYLFRKQEKKDMAIHLLREGIRNNPESALLYLNLGMVHFQDENYAEAEKVFESLLALRPELRFGHNLETYNYLLSIYQARGETAKISKLKKMKTNRIGEYYPMTHANYNAVKKILQENKIPLVAVQYPLREVGPLQKLLDPAPEVVFVDNQAVFQEAVEKDGYDEYFTDNFAGSFGHCTPKGNHLLATNVAQAILSNFFND